MAREALCRLLRAGTRCKFELLHGVPCRASVQMAQQLSVPVRFYGLQGKAWLWILICSGTLPLEEKSL